MKKMSIALVACSVLILTIVGLFVGSTPLALKNEGDILVTDGLLVSFNTEETEAGIKWQLKADHQNPDGDQRLKFKLADEQGEPIEDLTIDGFEREGEWYLEKDYLGNGEKFAILETPKERANLTLWVQVEQKRPLATTASTDPAEEDEEDLAPQPAVADETHQLEDILTEGEEGPYELLFVKEEPEESEESSEAGSAESESEETAETGKTDTTETAASTEETEKDQEEAVPAAAKSGGIQPLTSGNEVPVLEEELFIQRSDLLIGDKVFNDPQAMEIQVTRNGQPMNSSDYAIHRVNPGGSSRIYSSLDNMKSYTRTHYNTAGGRAMGKVFIVFPLGFSNTEEVAVRVKYPHVGSIRNADGEEVDVGAWVTIDHLKKQPYTHSSSGPLSTNHAESFYNRIVGIDLSTNLYSGTSLIGMMSSEWQFDFFYLDSGGNFTEEVDFTNDNIRHAIMTFSSLNGYWAYLKGEPYEDEPASVLTDKHPGLRPEFVAPRKSESKAIVTPDNHIWKGNVVTTVPYWYHTPGAPASWSGNHQTINDVYFGNSNKFEDTLGSRDFHKNAVSFTLSGKNNRFVMGTAGLRNFSQWNTFSSASVHVINHRRPAKTVQPLKQYQAGDTYDNPTGADSGWRQRLDNDLDRYFDGGSSWDLMKYYRQDGHDADEPATLAAGIPKKADRFVKTGQEHYYYVTQELINLMTEGIAQPNGFSIKDELPAGVELTDITDLYKTFTLYDLSGNPINNFIDTGKSSINKDGFNIVLTQTATDRILDQNRTLARTLDPDKRNEIRKDFSLRVRVKVTNTSSDQLNDLMENSAETVFHYDKDWGISNNQISRQTNKVHTRIKQETVTETVKKVAQDGKPLQVEFDYYQIDDNGQMIGEKRTVTSKEDGYFTLTGLKPGNYVLEETQVPAGYTKKTFRFTVDDTYQVHWQDPWESVYRIVDEGNEPIRDQTLNIYRVNNFGDPTGSSLGEVTTDRYGETRTDLSFLPAASYWLISKDQDTIRTKISIDDAGHILNMEHPVLIVNEKVAMKFKKVGEKWDDALANVSFDLFKSDKTGSKQGSALNQAPIVTDAEGDFLIESTLAEGYYLLEETAVPEGYQKRKFLLRVNSAGSLQLLSSSELPEGFYQAQKRFILTDNAGIPITDLDLFAFTNGVRYETKTNAWGWLDLSHWPDGKHILTASGFQKEITVKNGEPEELEHVLVFENHKIPLELELIKVDEKTKEPLQDVTFKLYQQGGSGQEIPPKDRFGNEIKPSEKSTDKDGKIHFTDLDPSQTYYLKEMAPLPGYQGNPNVYIVTYDGTTQTWKVYLNDLQTEYDSGSLKEQERLLIQFTVENQQEPLKISLEKIDSFSGKAIPETEFTLTDLTMNDSQVLKTNDFGKLQFVDLEVDHEYTLEETGTPPSYMQTFPKIRLRFVLKAGDLVAEWRLDQGSDPWKGIAEGTENHGFTGSFTTKNGITLNLIIENPPRGELPKTGGNGMKLLKYSLTIFALIGIFGILYFVKGRRDQI